jgi:hypothetical protein
MKVNVEVAKANDAYVDAIAKAMQGAGNVEQLQGYAKQLAPLGEIGMKFFQQFVEQGVSAASAGFKAGSEKK